MKKIYLFYFLLLISCKTINLSKSFIYKEIKTDNYTLASWQKITDQQAPIRIYIEGDGHAFNSMGYPTNDPTPKSKFLRKIAFNDPNKNVVYLARPCQYVKDKNCSQIDWTTGRFSKNIVNSTSQAIQKISNNQDIILIGYSGGALLSGIVINQNPQIPIKKWITIAGLLNHKKWTDNLKLQPLNDSIDLEYLPNIPQLHLIGKKDKIISYKLTQSIVSNDTLIIISKATHNKGFTEYIPIIYNFNI